jgi:nitrogen fixation NifU-like protein
MANPDGYARIKGPCGDTMEIYIRVTDAVITDASFMTDGCLTTIVSASMAVELATNTPVGEAAKISQADILENLGGLPKSSQHCALLAANTLETAVMDYLHKTNVPWTRVQALD